MSGVHTKADPPLRTNGEGIPQAYMENVSDLQSIRRIFSAVAARGIYDEAEDGRKSSARATNEQDTKQLTHVTSSSCMDPHFNPCADEQHIPGDIHDMGNALPYVSGKKTTPMRTCRCRRM